VQILPAIAIKSHTESGAGAVLHFRLGVLAAVASLSLALLGTNASAECTRLAFSVNDYGKDGPTADAKKLLDKHIAEQMSKRGISKYTVGKKDVTCELFLDFIVFDEHTCKAEATVCWPGGAPSTGGITGSLPAKAGKAKAAPKE
jgi:hypothetical protein